ncbi:protein-glutamate O-methyltransferase CheR [bacterium]|nr:protein-glutamate O-methyltransferase CheR [bacterium]
MTFQTENQFQELCQLILKQVGLDCQQYKVNYLKRRLAVRMRATKLDSYVKYRQLLENDSEEYGRLLDRLTINVSNFFRDTVVYDQIKRIIIPEIGKQRNIRIWSAGCANGEEPYSLAIRLKEGLPASGIWEILATDIDPTVLARARQGEYRDETIKNVPVFLRKKYFEKTEMTWKINRSIAEHVQFRQHDLTGSMPVGRFDLIVCRNVLIYFVAGLQEKLFKSFHELLRPNGFLVLGKTETLLGDMRRLYHIRDIRERIYQKKEAGPDTE